MCNLPPPASTPTSQRRRHEPPCASISPATPQNATRAKVDAVNNRPGAWPIWNSGRVRFWDSAAAKFTDEDPAAAKFTRPQHDHTTGAYVVAVLTGFITAGPGRDPKASKHDARANVYDRVTHRYAIWGPPGPLRLARRWHSRQAAWRCGRKVHGQVIAIPLASHAGGMLTPRGLC